MDGLNERAVIIGDASAIVAESAIISKRLRSRVLELRAVLVPEHLRGQGLGNALLTKICTIADLDGHALFLMPDDDNLESWYSRHGFERIQDDPVVVMLRRPRSL